MFLGLCDQSAACSEDRIQWFRHYTVRLNCSGFLFFFFFVSFCFFRCILPMLPCMLHRANIAGPAIKTCNFKFAHSPATQFQIENRIIEIDNEQMSAMQVTPDSAANKKRKTEVMHCCTSIRHSPARAVCTASVFDGAFRMLSLSLCFCFYFDHYRLN